MAFKLLDIRSAVGSFVAHLANEPAQMDAIVAERQRLSVSGLSKSECKIHNEQDKM